MRMLTVGHGTLPQDDFAALVRDADTAEIVDVRSFPGSRRNPQYGREAVSYTHLDVYKRQLPLVRWKILPRVVKQVG